MIRYAVYYKASHGAWEKDSEHSDFKCAGDAEWALIEKDFKTKIVNVQTGRRVRIPNPTEGA